MKRTYNVLAVAAAAVVLSGLAGCSAANSDKAQAAPVVPVQTSAPVETSAPAPGVPTDDDQRICRAAAADVEVGDKRLDNVSDGDQDRVLRIVRNLEGRGSQYPAASAELKAAVQKVADEYTAAAAKLGTSGYDAQVVKVRAAQTKLAGLCK